MSKWTKQTYETTAAILYSHLAIFYDGDKMREPSNQYHLGNIAALAEIQTKFADVFEADNPGFDRFRFIRACNTGDSIRTSIRLQVGA